MNMIVKYLMEWKVNKYYQINLLYKKKIHQY